MHPVEADGCGLVILRELSRLRYEVVDSGFLAYDGKTLWFEGANGTRRELPEDQWSGIMTVAPANRIPQCAEFNFFTVCRDA